MLHIYYGNDTVAVRKKAYDCIDDFEKKGFEVARIDSDTFSSGAIADAIGASSLFERQTLYVIDTPSSDSVFYEEAVERLSELGESSNTFVVIESALLAPEKKKFAKHAESIEESKAEASARFNTFAMAEALAKKDKKTLWILLQEAKTEGLSPEEIIGTLWWQLKALRLAQKTNSADEAGMKDFPYNKAKRALSIFKEGEPERISRDLLTVYHEGHLGLNDIDLALEKWTLTL
jgi:DNA polymerase III delta subunit